MASSSEATGVRAAAGAVREPAGAEGVSLEVNMSEDYGGRDVQDTPESERHNIDEESGNSDIEGR